MEVYLLQGVRVDICATFLRSVVSLFLYISPYDTGLLFYGIGCMPKC